MMKKYCPNKKDSGFTLIELLVVIAIITILAGVTMVLFNPATQIRKANEATLKANTAKLCSGLNACFSADSSNLAASCDTWTEMGVQAPTEPTGAVYIRNLAGDVVTVTGRYDTGSVRCEYTCNVNFNTGVVVNLTKGANCL